MVNTILIGQYIQFLRKQQHLSQKNLADHLGVSFQAVSKWETGENLPDASILLDLADALDTTTDKLLSAGNPQFRKNKKILISDLKEGLIALEDMRHFFGENSAVYRGAIKGINRAIKTDIERYFRDENSREDILANILIEYLVNGYTADIQEIEQCFLSYSLREKIKKYCFDVMLFQNKAQTYHLFRPPFPQKAIELLASIKKNPVIADIGSGTGRLCRYCIDFAETLYAVEPNEEMRNASIEVLGQYPNFIPIAASAEHTSLEENSIDIITIAGAYHYFDNEKARAELKRILKSDGYIFLFWDIYEGNSYDEEKEQIDQKYRKKKNRMLSGISRETRAKHLFGENHFKKVTFETILHQDFETFFGGWSSASYAPTAGSRDYEIFQKEARALFDRYAVNGVLDMIVQTICFYGKI